MLPAVAQIRSLHGVHDSGYVMRHQQSISTRKSEIKSQNPEGTKWKVTRRVNSPNNCKGTWTLCKSNKSDGSDFYFNQER